MVEPTSSLLVGLLALVWTGYQEVRMWKMCKVCPFYVAAELAREEAKKEV